MQAPTNPSTDRPATNLPQRWRYHVLLLAAGFALISLLLWEAPDFWRCQSWPPSKLKDNLTLGFAALAVVSAVLVRPRDVLPAAFFVLLTFTIVFSVHTGNPSGNESAAVAILRTIHTAEAAFQSSSRGRYGNMAELIDAKLLDDTFLSCKAGYWFDLALGDSDFAAVALPMKGGGRYGYFVQSDGAVRYETQNYPTCASCFPAGQAGEPVQ